MAKLRMDEVEEAPLRTDRAKAETEAQNTLYDGRKRLKTGKTRPIIFRTTEEKRAQILRLADVLSLGKRKNVSITETIEMAIEALDEKLKGKKA